MTKLNPFDLFRRKGNIPEFADGYSPSMEDIEAHIERFVGKPETVIHEISSEFVHVDVHVVRPTLERNFYTLVTSGMSDLPMKVPEGLEKYRFAELMLCLPENWPVPKDYEVVEGSWNQDWPIDALRFLARMPHQYKTWLGWGHSVPNGNPPQPVAVDSNFCGFVLLEPRTVRDEFHSLVTASGKRIYFLAVYPVYQEEMSLKVNERANRLDDLFSEYKITELLDPNRRNVALIVH